jgi:predicted dehydrogenase
MADKDLGIGLIGVGMGSDLFYLNEDPNSRFIVKAVSALNPAKLEKAATVPGVEFTTTKYQELLERDDIQVIGVFSPDTAHAEQAVAALEAGKHVVITKPMVVSLEQGIAVARAQDKAKKKVIVGETCRWYTSFLAAKKLLDDGDLGELYFSEAHYVHDLGDIFDLTPWRYELPQDFMFGGGCHPVDSLVWFMGEIDEVFVYANRTGDPRYPQENNYLINLKFTSGKIARVLAAYGMIEPPYPMMGLTIYGSKGTAMADFTDFKPTSCKVVLSKLEHKPTMVMNFPADLKGAYGQMDAVKRYMAAFEEAIVNDTPGPEDAWEGLKTISALHACWESVRTGKPVKVQNTF